MTPERPSPPARPRALLHVGLGKAGSASIQGFLALNAPALRAAGLHFDDLGGPRGPALGLTHGLPFLALAAARPDWLPAPALAARYGIHDRAGLRRTLDAFEARLDASLPAAGTWVASTEALSGLLTRPGDVAALLAALRPRVSRVEVLLILRDPVAWLPSHYNQLVRRGLRDSLDAFVEARAACHLDRLAALWADALGEDRLHLRLLQPDGLLGGDLLADLSALLGAPPGLPRPPRLNEGLSRRRIAALRLLNRTWGRLRPRGGQPGLLALTRPLAGGPKLALTPDQAARVRQANAASHERLRRRFFPGRPQLFPGP